ncbi:MAG: hypothetical protein ABI725_00995 [Chloroflexota bacterium]
MNSSTDLQRFVADWLEAEAPARAPASLLVRTLGRVAVMPQMRVLWRRGAANGHRSSRPILLVAATLVALSLLGGLAIFSGARPGPLPSPVPPSGTINTWTSFMTEDGIYQVREGDAARLVTARAPDSVDVCLGSGDDGTRVAYGRASGSQETGFRDAAVVILDLDSDGNVTDTIEIDVGGALAPPCPTWAPDHRSFAFAARETFQACRLDGGPADLPLCQPVPVEVWIVPLDDRPIVKLPERPVNALAWAPDSSRLAVADGDGVFLFAPESGEQRSLVTQTAVGSVVWSPDGTLIAYESGWTLAGDEPLNLVVHEIATGTEHVVASGYTNWGPGGAAWSPSGDKIASRRVCTQSAFQYGHPPQYGRCYEQTEVLLLTVGSGTSWLDREVSGRVLAPVLLLQKDGTTKWYFPYHDITWSLDSNRLLYMALGQPSVRTDGDEFTAAIVAVPVTIGRDPVVLAEWGGAVPELQ